MEQRAAQEYSQSQNISPKVKLLSSYKVCPNYYLWRERGIKLYFQARVEVFGEYIESVIQLISGRVESRLKRWINPQGSIQLPRERYTNEISLSKFLIHFSTVSVKL